MNNFGSTSDKLNDLNDCGLNIRHRHSFSAPDENYLNGGRDVSEKESENTSDCNFAESNRSPMLTNDTSADTDSRLRCSTRSVPFMKTYSRTIPQGTVPSHEVKTGWPLIYDQQQQLVYNLNPVPMVAPSLNLPKVQTQQMPTTIQSSLPVQPQFLVYPAPHCQYRPQNCTHMPAFTTAVPCMVRPVSHLYPSRPAASQAPTGAFTSVTIPSYCYYNSAGNLNKSGWYSTPAHSTSSCTSMASSYTHDVVPILKLCGDNAPGCPMPKYLSCSINGGPVSDGHSYVSKNLAAVPVTSRILMKQNISTNRTSHHQERGELSGEKVLKKDEHLWQPNMDYAEFQRDGCSNLFVTWSGSVAEMVDIYRNFNLEILEVLRTTDESIHNVIFVSHIVARKAFTLQKQIRLRAVPPKNSIRNWLRSPSPKFLVNFETKRRLVVRKGKAECHDIVGDLLKGCLIWADQLKGNRMRLVGCEGNFMFTGGKIVEMKGTPSKSGKRTCLGWISYRSKYTKEPFLIRRTWNKLEEYIFNECLVSME